MFKHHDVWRAIDRLAEKNGLSPSGLARKAGLSPTLFNPSKRATRTRKRWPSTESISAVLSATGSSLEEFAALASSKATQHTRLPVLPCKKASEKNAFDEQSRPRTDMWDEMPLPAALDANAFVLEIDGSGFGPCFSEGKKIVLSPAETPRRGDLIALLTREGEIAIKKLGSGGTQNVELLSPVPDEPPLTLSRKDIVWLYRIVWASM